MAKKFRSPMRLETKSREQLIDELSFLEDALDTLPEAFAAFDEAQDIAYFNAAYNELFPSVATDLRPGLWHGLQQGLAAR